MRYNPYPLDYNIFCMGYVVVFDSYQILFYPHGHVKLYKTMNHIDLWIIRIYGTFDIYENSK